MAFKKFLKRLTQPSSFGGLAAIAIAVPQVLGIGGDVGSNVADGISSAGQALGAGVPWYIAIGLGLAAVITNDKSNDDGTK